MDIFSSRFSDSVLENTANGITLDGAGRDVSAGSIIFMTHDHRCLHEGVASHEDGLFLRLKAP